MSTLLPERGLQLSARAFAHTWGSNLTFTRPPSVGVSSDLLGAGVGVGWANTAGFVDRDLGVSETGGLGGEAWEGKRFVRYREILRVFIRIRELWFGKLKLLLGGARTSLV